MVRTIVEAAQAIRARTLTPSDLVEQCLAAVQREEARVRAWVFVDAEAARAQAAALTLELARGHSRGPLHGIPMGVKDLFDIFDWPTAAGSALWARSIARQDAEVIARLRAAGVIFLGKTVTTAFASFDPPVTRNPWDAARTPGGSSSGSAAALAAGMCLASLGSQTGGSLTRPASFCGVACLKPTHDAVPVAGVVPLAPSMDHVGPMAHTVADLRLLFDAMASPRITQPLCASLARVGGLFEELATPGIRLAFDEACQRLAEKMLVHRAVLPARFGEVLPRHRMLMAVEAAVYHGARLARHPEDYPPRIRGLIEEGLACPAPEMERTREHRRMLMQEMDALLAKDTILLCPATTSIAPAADTTGDPAFNSPWSYLGLPTVSFPTGLVDGMPVAIQLVGRRHGETDLLRAAERCAEILASPLELQPPQAGGVPK